MGYSVTVKIVASGTNTSNGGNSKAGHMWYSLSDGNGNKQSYGFGPVNGGPFGQGSVIKSDDASYTSPPAYSKTINLTESQYNDMKNFGDNPAAAGFSTDYNALTNSCVDFTWKALEKAGFNPTGFEGDLFPMSNRDEIEKIFNTNPPCLAPGTLIRTPTGNRLVEELQIGDLVLTPDGPQPLKFLGISTRHVNILKASGRMPIRIQAGVFGDNLPSADIYCTPSHAFALGDCLVEAQALINGQSIYQLEELSEYDQWRQIEPHSPLAEHKEVAKAMVMADFFTYYSLEFEQHVLVWANDLLTESYLPTYRDGELTRVAWNNYDNYLSLYESSESMEELPMPRIPFSRQIPLRIREQFGLDSIYGPNTSGANREELCLTL